MTGEEMIFNSDLYGDAIANPGIMAALVAFGFVFVLILLAVYIYSAIAVLFIARKTKTPNRWLAFVPIANFYLLTQMAGKSGWWALTILLGFIPMPILGLIPAGIAIWFFWIVAEKIKFPGWTSLLLIIPIVNLVILGIWAWSRNSKKKR